MRTCKKCQTENEEENKFCKNCRASLVVKEEAFPEGDETDAHKKNKKVCPKCRVIYEKEEHCVKCKSKLVPTESLEQKVEEKAHALFEEKEVPPVHVPPMKQKEPSPPSPERDTFKINAALDVMKEPSQSPILSRRAKRLLEDRISILSRSRKRNTIFSPLSLAAAGVIVVIAVMTYLPTRGSEPSTSTSRDSLVLSPTVSSSPSVNPSPQGEEQEIERIKALLENIRKANLQKNIDLFMSCYALDFKNREEKKRSTVETWKNFNYMDLSYTVKNQTVSGDTASIEVEWLIKISQDKNRQPQENRTVIDASLKKEDGNWRIKETRTAS
jgi:ketosteroid isomerase-like protein